MNVDDFDALYGSKYIGVSDLKDREPRVTIRNVETTELREKEEEHQRTPR
jgi:hypothetical protein